MFASLLILLVLPLTDLSRIRGNEYKPLSRFSFWVLSAVFFILMQIGARHAEAPYILVGQIATALYFSYFLLFVPLFTLLENSIVDLKSFYSNGINTSFKLSFKERLFNFLEEVGLLPLNSNSVFLVFSFILSVIPMIKVTMMIVAGCVDLYLAITENTLFNDYGSDGDCFEDLQVDSYVKSEGNVQVELPTTLNSDAAPSEAGRPSSAGKGRGTNFISLLTGKPLS